MAASNEITIYDAAVWLARMAAADGVVTPRESKILQKFAAKYSVDINLVRSVADHLASETNPEVIYLSEEYLKGYDFEKFVVGSICTDRQDSKFSVISWRSDKECNGIFADDCKKPDLHIKCAKPSAVWDFYLECKYRSSIVSLDSLKKYQLQRYADIAKADKKLAFIAVGMGGSPTNPASIYFVPLWEWLRDTPDFEKYRFQGDSLTDFVYNTLQEYMSHMDRILHRT